MTEKLRTRERLDLGRRIIVFIGKEGSGKTTQAKRMAAESGGPYITTRGILEDLALNDRGLLGDEVRNMFEKHVYLSGESLLRILANRFSQDDVSGGLILDGGLRTLEETLGFQAMLDEAGCDLPVTIIYLQMPTTLSFVRLVDGENARRRDDDTVEGVTTRLEMFFWQLEERMEAIANEAGWSLVEVDASGPVEEVYRSICEVLTD